MKDKVRFFKDYRNNETLWNSFNALAMKTFGIHFGEWRKNGYWKSCYIPCSLAEGETVVANVSVNLMKFNCMGTEKRYIQLGTVMTDEAYRGRGLSRYLIERILEEYENDSDGIYLFANDSVLDFYPKFGFRPCREYQYEKERNSLCGGRERSAVKADMDSKSGRRAFEEAVLTGACCSAFGMRDNSGLVMFYAAGPMKDCVYKIESERAYAVAELEGDTLVLYDVFAPDSVEPERIASAFGGSVKRIRLGFTPLCTEGYEKKVLQEEDTTLFVRGREFDGFEMEEKMFPLLSHA